MLIDQLVLIATDDTKDFVNGVVNFTVPLTSAESPYQYFFTALDEDNNEVSFAVNYTFTVVPAIPAAVTILFPTEDYNFTAICDLPFWPISDEVEIDSWWYSLDGGTTNTTFTPNQTLFDITDGDWTLLVWINLTNGGISNSSNVNFSVAYDGLYWQGTDDPATLLNNIEEVFINMSAIALAILAAAFLYLSSRFETTNEVPFRAGCIITGILLAANSSLLIVEETTTLGMGAFKLLIWAVRLTTICLFMVLLLKSIKALSDVPKPVAEKY